MEKGRSGGCERWKTWEEEIYWKLFSSFHFFASLPRHFQHHLVLPEKFTENMVANLAEKVSLIGPSGATRWDVELIKTSDNIAFGGEGWKEFVRAHDLEENNFLVFKYKLNSSFEVLIFDPKSFCEKEAGYFVRPTEKAGVENKKRTISEAEDNNDQDNDSDSSDSEYVVYKKSRNANDKEPERRMTPLGTTRKLIPCECQSTSKTQSERKSEGNRVVHDVVEEEPREIGGSVLETTRSRRLTQGRGGQKKREKYATEYKSNRRPVTEIEKTNALSRATTVQGLTENSLLRVMYPSAVYKRFSLNIPCGWMKKYPLNGSCEAGLRMGEKIWMTSFYRNDNVWNWRALRGLGWKKFVLDNNLEEFDVCVFSLNSQKDDPETVLDVQIFRVIPEIVPSSPVVAVHPKSA